MQLVADHVGGVDQPPQGRFRSRVHLHGGGEKLSVIVEQQHEVRADAPHVVVRGREHRGGVPRGDRLAEPEICRENAYAARQLRRPEAQELLDEVAAGGELLGSPVGDRAFHARKHCDQRHTLCGDDQPDNEHEKSVAETAHNIESNETAR